MVADPAEGDDSAAADSARGADPAGQSPPAVMTPARSQTPAQQGRDHEPSSEDGSVIFLSLSKRINQTSLLDFMSMMTLMQRHMDTVMPAPENPDIPPVERSRRHVTFKIQNRRISGPCKKVQDSSKKMQRF